MDLSFILVFQTFNGVVWGLIFALIALGLSLTFGLMNLMNVSHASFYMLGAVLTAQFVTRLGLGFWTGALLATIAVGVLGIVVNKVILERIAVAPPAIGLLATAGLLLVIDNSTLATFGSVPVSVEPPIDATLPIFGIEYPAYRLLVAGVAVVILTSTFLFLRFTRVGLWMRAVPQQRELASISGISSNRVNMATVILGSLLAGIAGALITPIAGAHFQMGSSVLAVAFTVIVVGGVGNLWGAVVIAILLGIIRGVGSALVTPTQAEILSLVVLLPLLLLWPNGIFAKRRE
jgi:branched-chain amino acid transport system permease protein